MLVHDCVSLSEQIAQLKAAFPATTQQQPTEEEDFSDLEYSDYTDSTCAFDEVTTVYKLCVYNIV